MTLQDSPPDHDLMVWIVALRARLRHRDLAGYPSIALGYGTGILTAEQTIELMLADLDDDDGRDAAHQLRLLDDFRRLQALIG